MEILKKELSDFRVAPRLKSFREFWDSNFADVDAIVIRNGKDDPDSIKLKTSAFHSWLFKCEFVNTLVAVTQSKIVVLGSSEKIRTLEKLEPNLQNSGYTLHLINKTEDLEAVTKEFIEKFTGDFAIDEHKGLKFGAFLKETHKGKFIEEFDKQIGAIKHEFVEIGPALQEFMSIKRPEDLGIITKSAKLTAYFFDLLIQEIENIIETEVSITHEQLSNKMDELLKSKSSEFARKFNVEPSFYDFAYAPIIQSGGVYDLKPNAESTNATITHDCILLSVGSKYFEFNTNLIRTLLINATKEEQAAYMAVYKGFKTIIQELKPKAVLKDVYEKAREAILSVDRSYQAALPNYFGFGMGLEFRESCLLINDKNDKKVKENQIYNIVISLKNLKTSSGRNFCIQIGDTVRITDEGNIVLTDSVSKKYDDIGYTLDGNAEEDKTKVEQKPKQKTKINEILNDNEPGYKTRYRRRYTEKVAEENDFKKMKEHQKELLEQKQVELERRLEEGNFITSHSDKNQIKLEKIRAYRDVTEVPKNIAKNSIFVDMNNDSLLLPIHGKIVPFHISVLKNVSRQSEGRITSIRFNFNIPGSTNSTRIVFPDPRTLDFKPIYIKELVFRSTRADHLNNIYRQVKELQKSYKHKEIMDETSSKRGTLELVKGKKPSLQNLKLRPHLSGRKTVGTLECHQNGFRFMSKKNETLDILFSNIKHAFFQPCDGEMIVLLHLHLRSPCVVGKKKVGDIQFYTEAGNFSEDVTDIRARRYNDFDEQEQDELDKQQREKLNREFSHFVDVVEKFTKNRVTFDIPYKNLGFTGSPSNNNVLLVPTVNCLVHLTHQPFLVVSLQEIEVAFLERVGFMIKNFDLVLIYKDYSRPVTFINAIPTQFKDQIKTWLDSSDIIFFESQTNFKWDKLLKRFRNDPELFVVNEGGWSAFAEDSEEEEEVDVAGNEEDADSAFSVDGEEEGDETESEYTDDDFADDDEGDEAGEDSYQEEDEITEEESEEYDRKKKLKK